MNSCATVLACLTVRPTPGSESPASGSYCSTDPGSPDSLFQQPPSQASFARSALSACAAGPAISKRVSATG